MEELTFSRFRLFLLALVTLVVYLLSYTDYGVELSFLFFTTAILLIAIRLKAAIPFFLFGVLVFDDINKYDNDMPPFNTLFTVTLGGVSLSMILTVIIFIFLLISLVGKHSDKWRIPHPMLVVLLFLLLGLLTIFQYKNDYFISDVGFVVNMLAGFLAGQALLQNDRRVRYYFVLVVTVLFAKYVFVTLDAIHFSLIGRFYSFKGESAANYIVIPLVMLLMLLFYKRLKLALNTRLLLSLALMFLFAYLFITISRERILLCALALLTFLVIYKKTRIILYFGVLTGLAILAISRYNPNMYNYVNWKLTTYMPSTSGRTNPSSTVRVIELKNIWQEQLEKPYKLFIGTGWGGYFTSRNFGFTKEILGTRSYPPESIERDTFFRPHGTYLYVMLKYGLVGMLLFYGSLIAYSAQNVYDKTIYRIHAAQADQQRAWLLRYIQVTLAIAVPLVSLVIFTSKLQILTGFFLAMISSSRKWLREMEQPVAYMK